MLFFIWSLIATAAYAAVANAAVANACNAADAVIHSRKGSTFASVFRSYGGFYVSKSSYERKIVDNMNLSPSCAVCYGDAYICGWSNCKMSCMREGKRCDACLQRMGCIDAVNKCTGFPAAKL